MKTWAWSLLTLTLLCAAVGCKEKPVDGAGPQGPAAEANQDEGEDSELEDGEPAPTLKLAGITIQLNAPPERVAAKRPSPKRPIPVAKPPEPPTEEPKPEDKNKKIMVPWKTRTYQ